MLWGADDTIVCGWYQSHGIGRQVDAGRRGVHGVAVRHDAGRADRLARALQVDGCDPRHAETGELARRGDGRAVERRPTSRRTFRRSPRRTNAASSRRPSTAAMISLLRCSARSSSKPNMVGVDERKPSIEDASQHESGGSVDRPCGHEVTLEVAAVQQRRRTSRRDVVQRDDGVDAACTAAWQPASVCRRAATGGCRPAMSSFGDHVQRSATSTILTPSCEATNTCVPSVSTMSPSSTSDLLRVRSREVGR